MGQIYYNLVLKPTFLDAGLAVGEEKFMADASEVMDLLLKTHTEGDQLPADDPQTSYLISAWSRICKIMGVYSFQTIQYHFNPFMRVFLYSTV